MDGSGETYTTNGGFDLAVTDLQCRLHWRNVVWRPVAGSDQKSTAARIVLAGSAILIAGLTLIFGIISRYFQAPGACLAGAPFTIRAAIFLSVALFAAARFASAKVATFLVSFLAVQCVLNDLGDLKPFSSFHHPGPRTSLRTR